MSRSQIKRILSQLIRSNPEVDAHDIHIDNVRGKGGEKTGNVKITHLPTGKSITANKSDPNQKDKLEQKLGE
jgi:protein subunit release factor A